MAKSYLAKRKRPQSLCVSDSRKTTKKGKLAIENVEKEAAAERLAKRLHGDLAYLTDDKASWYILAKNWFPSSRADFEKEWNLHPTQRHALKLFGRTVYEKRWSQSWGYSYAYSGSINVARPVEEGTMVPILLKKINSLIKEADWSENMNEDSPFNGCLQNWYEPQDTIGLHADDESSLRRGYPIFSLSWGGARRFLFRSKKTRKRLDLLLKDGDLLVMGGTCQETHHHELPKRRVTMDPPTSNRINWTIRSFNPGS